jgi:hypothetical protein
VLSRGGGGLHGTDPLHDRLADHQNAIESRDAHAQLVAGPHLLGGLRLLAVDAHVAGAAGGRRQ